MTEAENRGSTVSDLIRSYIDQGLAADAATGDATVRVADVQRAIAGLVSKRAA